MNKSLEFNTFFDENGKELKEIITELILKKLQKEKYD